MNNIALPFTSINYVRLNAAGFDADALDWKLLSLWFALLSLGLIMVASASITFADHHYTDAWFFAKRHFAYILLGIFCGALVALVPTQLWRNNSSLLLLLALIMLVLVLLPGIGRRVNGAQRWLALGVFTLQASEVAKFSVVIFFASFFERRQLELQQGWWGFFKPVLVVALFSILLLLEPDFGSTVVICITVFSMLFLAGVRIWQYTLLLLVCVSSLAIMAYASPYRMKRLVAYLDPWADQFDSGYQLTQSLIAFGRGEWFGAGLGNSVQKLFYLPEAHTDFIFAIYAEEFGLVGVVIVVALFAALIWRILLICQRAIVQQKRFQAFSAFGFAVLISCQAFINIGVASGLLPTKGLTLPFISYGGSSLLVSCALIGFLLRMDWELRNDLGVKA